MEVEVEITRGDYVNFNHYVTFKKQRKRMLLIFAALVFILSFISYRNYEMDVKTYFSSVLYITFILGLIYFAGIFIFIEISARSLPSKKGYILGRKKYILADEGFIQEAETNRTVHKWNSVLSVEESEKTIYVFVDSMAAYIIPKKYFSSSEDKEKFFSRAKSKMSESSL